MVTLAERALCAITTAQSRAARLHVLGCCAGVVTVFGVVRSGRAAHVAFEVGSCIMAARWSTSSTSFANPAITIGRILSDTFAGIAPSAPPFVLVQLLGGVRSCSTRAPGSWRRT